MPSFEPRTCPPAIFRLARHLQKREIRGSTFLLRALKRLGLLDRPVVFPIDKTINLELSLRRLPIDAQDFAVYESEYIYTLASLIEKLPSPVTLIDVGADIGHFALKLISASPAIQRVFAFEPSSEGFTLLQKNLAQLGFPVRAIPKGVADFEGRGTLVSPAYGTNDTANFIEPSDLGNVAVTKVDSLGIRNASLCLKIDVEGSELAVLHGAEKTVQSAQSIVVGLEAHPLVVQRTGIDPIECLRLLESWRPFSFFVSETKMMLDTTRAVFAQLPDNRIYNLVGTTSSVSTHAWSESARSERQLLAS